MKTLLLSLSLAATMSATAQTEGDAGIWYTEGAAYVATFNPADRSIRMEGGTPDEARAFTLRLQNPDDPFAYDVASGTPPWPGAVQAYPDAEDGRGYYIFANKARETVAIMYKIPSVELLEDIVRDELAAIVEGEYRDGAGRKVTISGETLQLPGRKSQAMTFARKGNTPVNVMVAEGKSWRFTGTYDGLTLQPVRREGTDYVPVEGTEPMRLVRRNGTTGRWPLTSMAPVQHTMLQYLDTEALRYMHREIYARLGNPRDDDPKVEAYFKRQPWFSYSPGRTHLTKLELYNAEVIMTEEARRQNSTAAPAAEEQGALYKATITGNGGVQIDFNMEETNRYATSFLDHPACVTRSAEVEGLEGKVVELLKTNMGPDWNPVLLMRTEEGNVFLLNVRETIDDGNYACGRAWDIKGAKALKAMKQQGQPWTTPAAVLENGETAFIMGSGSRSGYYVIDGRDLIIHITADYGIVISNGEGEPIASGTWHQSWAGSGMEVLSCALDKGQTEIEMYDEEPTEDGEQRASFKIEPIQGQPATLLAFDEKLHGTLKEQCPY